MIKQEKYKDLSLKDVSGLGGLSKNRIIKLTYNDGEILSSRRQWFGFHSVVGHLVGCFQL